MNFFESLKALIPGGGSLAIVLTSEGETLTVSLLPRNEKVKDEALKRIAPMVISGTAVELDTDFFNTVSGPIQKATGIINKAAEYEENLKKVEAQTKEQKDKEEKEKKEADAQKKKYDEAVKKADGSEKEEKWGEAITFLQEAQKLTKTPEKLDKRILDLKGKYNSGGLFAPPSEENAEIKPVEPPAGEDYEEDTATTNEEEE